MTQTLYSLKIQQGIYDLLDLARRALVCEHVSPYLRLSDLILDDNQKKKQHCVIILCKNGAFSTHK